MKIDHIRFCVNDAQATRDWFIQQLGFVAIGGCQWCDTQMEVVGAGQVYFVLCSPLSATSPAAKFLEQHPAGVWDVVFRTVNLTEQLHWLLDQGARLIQPICEINQPGGCVRWAAIAAFGDLVHTLVERQGKTTLLPWQAATPQPITASSSTAAFVGIDHVVLNVPVGQLAEAIAWYQTMFGFVPQQRFEIQTDYSGLCSQVLIHPDSGTQLPINQPASANSQIQEFLEINRGAGVQHIALETRDLVETVARLRQTGLDFLTVPASYYTDLQQRDCFVLSKMQLNAIAAQQILVDWQPTKATAVLLQTFTQPIFTEPTFFFELIQRQTLDLVGQCQRAEGFGEGNFRALFEAIEREQVRRGSLHSETASVGATNCLKRLAEN